MDPRHRDRIYFLRIVSGMFQRDMMVRNPRTGQQVRLANSQRVFAQERETLDEACAGDVIGIVGNHDLRIGDTLSVTPDIVFDETPRFIPECFAHLHGATPAHYKRFREGMEQLLQEGVVQQYQQPLLTQSSPLLGAVGPLQFEVVQYRLKAEYKAESRIETAPYSLIRWLRIKDGAAPLLKDVAQCPDATLAHDESARPVVLLGDVWTERMFLSRNKELELLPEPPGL